MRVGVFAPPWGPTATPDGFDQVAAAAEQLGFPSLWIGDHIVFPRQVDSAYLYNESGVSPFDPDGPLLDPITLISYIAGSTERIDLGISVLVVPIRNPVESAKLLADIDALSRGRLILGVGVGWMREEFEVLGADFERRGAITDEWLQIMRHTWSGSAEGFAGEHYQFPPIGMVPSPSRIPIIVGGNSTVAMRRAAHHHGWHAIRMEPEDLGPRVARVVSLAEKAGTAREDYQIVYRGSLLGPERVTAGPAKLDGAGARTAIDKLEAYRSAGIDELILEFPDVTATRRIEWMEWWSEQLDLG